MEEQGLGDDEDPALGTVKPVETWEPGKAWQGLSPARAQDSYRFYFDLQNAFYDGETKLVRQLGLPGPLTGSNHWVDRPADLYANSHFDLCLTATPTGPILRAASATTPKRSAGIQARWRSRLIALGIWGELAQLAGEGQALPGQ